MRFKRIFAIVIDSVGCGACKDSDKFFNGNVPDDKANTIGHIAKAVGGIKLPCLESLGYGNLTEIEGVHPSKICKAAYGKAQEISLGKDTLTGHFEIMGLNVTKPFKTFTETGFPKELIDELEKRTGHKVIGNKSASGTEILVELGEQQMKDNSMIVYTSSDSVLQIAAHEDTFGLEELYRCCKIAREICMKPEWQVGRIIARPYVGTNHTNFVRTPNRHDYAVSPFEPTVLDHLKEKGLSVIALGKISDIYNTCGITESIRQASNHEGMDHMIDICKNKNFTGLCYLNLVDFDSLYGHRRNPQGYADAMVEFDGQLKTLIENMNEDDLVMVTADHGNDPTYAGTDHTREYTPVLCYHKNIKHTDLGIRESFADFGNTIAENFGVEESRWGKSFLKDIE
jgi:phosphopentomutase